MLPVTCRSYVVQFPRSRGCGVQGRNHDLTSSSAAAASSTWAVSHAPPAPEEVSGGIGQVRSDEVSVWRDVRNRSELGLERERNQFTVLYMGQVSVWENEVRWGQVSVRGSESSQSISQVKWVWVVGGISRVLWKYPLSVCQHHQQIMWLAFFQCSMTCLYVSTITPKRMCESGWNF